MAKFLTEYFENFERSYDDFEKEGMNLDDLQVKNKFNFMNGKYTFSSKSKFNFGAKNRAAHEFGLKHKCKRATIDCKSKDAGEVSIESDSKCVTKDNMALYTYAKFALDQGENRRNLNTDVMFRIHHKDNVLFSFGVEKFNFSSAPTNYSAYGSYGHNMDGNDKVTANVYLNYDVKNKFLPLAKFLIKGQKDKVHGYVQANINSTQNTVEDSEKQQKIVTSQQYDFIARVISQVTDSTKAGATLRYNVDKKQADLTLSGSHVVDRVRFNGKLSCDNSLTLGVTSVFDDVTVNFAARSELKTTKQTVEEKEVSKHHVNYNFGLSAEFNRL